MNARLSLTLAGLLLVPVVAHAQAPPQPVDGAGVTQLPPVDANTGADVVTADTQLEAVADVANMTTADEVRAYLDGSWYADLNSAVAEAMRNGWNAGWAADAFRALGGNSYAQISLSANGTGSGNANVVGMTFADSGSFDVTGVSAGRANVTMTAPAYNTTTSGSVTIEGPDSFVLNAMGYRLRFTRQ